MTTCSNVDIRWAIVVSLNYEVCAIDHYLNYFLKNVLEIMGLPLGSKPITRNQKGHQMLDIISQNQTFILYYHSKP
jgi:hypothetical protein